MSRLHRNSDRRHRLGMVLVSAGLLAFVVGFSSARAGANPVTVDDFTITGPSVSTGGGSTTFTWTLVGSHGHSTNEPIAVSHLVIGTCLGLTATSTNGGAATPNDPTTGASGYKWGSATAGDTFSITYAGTWDASGTATWALKKGSGVKTGSSGGPDCSAPTTTTTTAAAPATTTTTAPTTTTTTVAVAPAPTSTTTTTAAAPTTTSTTTTTVVVAPVVATTTTLPPTTTTTTTTTTAPPASTLPAPASDSPPPSSEHCGIASGGGSAGGALGRAAPGPGCLPAAVDPEVLSGLESDPGTAPDADPSDTAVLGETARAGAAELPDELAYTGPVRGPAVSTLGVAGLLLLGAGLTVQITSRRRAQQERGLAALAFASAHAGSPAPRHAQVTAAGLATLALVAVLGVSQRWARVRA